LLVSSNFQNRLSSASQTVQIPAAVVMIDSIVYISAPGATTAPRIAIATTAASVPPSPPAPGITVIRPTPSRGTSSKTSTWLLPTVTILATLVLHTVT
jgi:hypothetical protein